MRTRGAVGDPHRRPARGAPRADSPRSATGTSVGLVGDRDLTGGGTAHRAVRGPGAAAPRAGDARGRERRAGVRRRRPARRRRGSTRAARAGRRPGGGHPARARRRRRWPRSPRAFERVIEDAPEQWWAVFFPIWPDLEADGGDAPARSTPRRSREHAERPGAPTCTSTPSPRTARPTSRPSSTTSAAGGDLDVIAITDHERIDAARRRPGDGRATSGLPFEVIVGEEVTTRGGHLLALFIERPDPAVPLAARRRSPTSTTQGGLAIPAHPLVPYPLCAQGWVLRRLLDDPDAAVRPGRPRGVQPDGARPAVARSCRAVRRRARPRPRRQQRRPRARAPSAPAGRRSQGRTAADLRRGHRGRHDRPPAARSTARPARSGVFGQQLRKRGRDARDEVARPRPPRRHRSRPRLPGRPAAAAALRRPRTTAMKIGLVCPYIYPETGGVAQHVRFLYENLRLRGHDVRIITASHGPQRSSEGDIIRLGRRLLGADQRIGRHAHVLAALPEPDRRRCSSASGSTCSTSTSRSCRSCRSSCCASRRASTSRRSTPTPASRRRTSSAAGPAGPRGAAPRPDRGQRRGAPLHRPLLPGRLQGHPQRRRRRALRQRRPARALAGRHPERPVRRPPRAAQGPARPAQGPPHPAQDRLEPRLLVVGSGPQEREARRYVATRGLQGVEFLGRVSDAEKAQLFRTADVYVSPATGGESFGIVLLEAMAAGTPDRVLRHPRLQGRRPARPRGPARAAARAHASWPSPSTACCATRRCARRWAPPASARAEEFSWPRVTAKVEDYYGFVIRRLAAAGHAAGRTSAAEIPQAPPRPGEAVRVVAVAAASRTRPPPRFGQRQPPDRGRVGDHQAGHADGHGQERQGRVNSGVLAFRSTVADRELERVQVGRQQALVGVDDGRGQGQRGDVRVEDDEPADGGRDDADDVAARVARAEDLDGEIRQRERRRPARSARPGRRSRVSSSACRAGASASSPMRDADAPTMSSGRTPRSQPPVRSLPSPSEVQVEDRADDERGPRCGDDGERRRSGRVRTSSGMTAGQAGRARN